VRKARSSEVKLAIGTDAHNMGQLWMIELGVGVARKGWCEAKDVLNTLSYKGRLHDHFSLRREAKLDARKIASFRLPDLYPARSKVT